KNSVSGSMGIRLSKRFLNSVAAGLSQQGQLKDGIAGIAIRLSSIYVSTILLNFSRYSSWLSTDERISAITVLSSVNSRYPSGESSSTSTIALTQWLYSRAAVDSASC